jgi:decaprenyl-phosphate phosphoribosyltransferase
MESFAQRTEAAVRPTLRGHIQIARLDHWVKNVFVLPGLVVAFSIDPLAMQSINVMQLLAGILAASIITSSNYVINEVLDAPFDRIHPIKRNRPVPSGQVSIPLAYMQWIVLMLAGLALAAWISWALFLTLAALWVMGCIYNIPPIRTKDVPYIDVLTESVNNPLRMLVGWFLSGTQVIPPSSLLTSYWMIGCYFMGIKRFAEYREIANATVSAKYRKSFSHYNESRLLNSIIFYGCCSMLFLGAFIAMYRIELLLSFPLVAIVMAVYFSLVFKPDSSAHRPEGLYREKWLMTAVSLCAIVMTALLFIDMPSLHKHLLATPISTKPVNP